jgi:hypothetical protein
MVHELQRTSLRALLPSAFVSRLATLTCWRCQRYQRPAAMVTALVAVTATLRSLLLTAAAPLPGGGR